MLLDYHSFYGQQEPAPPEPTPAPVGGGAWFPRKKPAARRRQQQAVATVTATLPPLQARMVATVRPVPAARGVLRLRLPPLQAKASGMATTPVCVAATLAALQADGLVRVAATGRLDAELQPVTVRCVGQAAARGRVRADLPPVGASRSAVLTVLEAVADVRLAAAPADDEDELLMAAAVLLAELDDDEEL